MQQLTNLSGAQTQETTSRSFTVITPSRLAANGCIRPTIRSFAGSSKADISSTASAVFCAMLHRLRLMVLVQPSVNAFPLQEHLLAGLPEALPLTRRVPMPPTLWVVHCCCTCIMEFPPVLLACRRRANSPSRMKTWPYSLRTVGECGPTSL